MALDETIIEFLSPINVAKNISIDGRSLGENAFNSTTIPTNNNQLVNGEGYITAASLQGVPAILSNGVIPSLNSGITAAEVRSLIGAGTGGGSVTSVGLSMDGNAVGVNGSPITSSGTLDISWIGNSNQYVNGEGNLVNFPSIPQGDITQVVAEGGLKGGGSSGSVTVEVQYEGEKNIINSAVENNTDIDAKDLILYKNNTDDIVYSARVTDLITASGVITGVDAGTGMTGGGSIGNVQLNVIGGSGITANANDITVDSTVLRTTGAQVIGSGTKTFNDDVYFNDSCFQPYHSVASGAYYYDTYAGNNNLRWFVQGAKSDIIRYQSYSNTEYWNGSSWIAWNNTTMFNNILDGQKGTSSGASINNTTKKFRFEVSANTGWPTTAILWIETSWTGFTYPGLTVEIEEYDNATGRWDVNAGATSDFERTNGFTNWGLNAHVINSIHTGDNRTRFTLTWGAIPTTGSYTTVPLLNVMLTSNFSGLDNTVFPFTVDYNKNLTTTGNFYGAGGNSTEWNSAYDNTINKLAVTGSTTKTLTATQVDGGTLTASWTQIKQELLLEGTELTISDGNSVELPTSIGPKGDQGIQGIQGTQGDIGLTGAKGNAGTNGAKGDQGVRGLQGIQGDIGLTGSKGAQGGTGAKGDQGIQGIQGGQGDIGLTGSKGAAGTNGTNGARGLTGLTGAAGGQGIQGLKGNTGSQGGTGSKGDQGIQGIQGGQGDIGLTGSKGSTGSAGTNGTNGAKGATGAAGATGGQGIQGLKGSTGTAGTNGTNGAKGDQGIRGLTGTTGTTGTKGDQGIQGIQGPQGDLGAKGGTGLTGAKGDTGGTGGQGIQGLKGSTGAAGSNGTNGARGLTGLTGAAGGTGSQGIRGLTGAAGTNGTNGAQGDKGLTGNTGAKGNAGTNGTNGAKGDVGAAGGQGIQGIRGVTGLTGAGGSTGLQGTPGAAGSNGAKGDVGAQGGKGDQGATGNTGSQGIKGSTGTAGTNGTNGAKGSTGSTGPKGSTGSTGPTGGQGIQGIRGATGSAGTNGTNGNPGATGSKGATGSQGSTGSQGPRGFTGASGGSFPVTIDKNEPSTIKSMSVNTTSRNPFATVVLDNGTSFLLTVYSLMTDPGK